MAEKKTETTENYRKNIEKLKLEMRSAMLLSRTSNTFSGILSNEIFESTDPEIRSFVEFIVSKQKITIRGLVMIAAGEIAFAALLIFLSLSFIVPAFFAYANPGVFLGYLYRATQAVSVSALADRIVVLIDFVVCVVMLLSALQLLRTASDTLRNAGMRVTEAN